MTQENNKNEAAVAETVGFIYIFAIVILSISLIYSMGYPALQSTIDASIFESSEQSFIVLQSNMKMVAFDQVPVKNLQIQLQGSTLSITNNSNITIEYSNKTLTYATGEIEFQKNDRYLIYENGGVWKRYPDGSIMVSNPRIYTDNIYGTNTTTIGVVSIRGNSSTGGKGIAVLNMRYNTNTSEIYANRTLANLTLKINSINADKWKIYLNSKGFDTESDNSSVTAWRNNTALIVARHLVDVEIY